MTLLQREGERERTRVEFALQAGRLRGSRESGKERMLVYSMGGMGSAREKALL